MAPELQSGSYLYSNSSPTSAGSAIPIGTPKGDVYSFAIIAQEILYRKGVFYLTDEDRKNFFPTADSIHGTEYDDYDNFPSNNNNGMRCLSYRELFEGANKRGLRPSIDATICYREIADLLKKCWSDQAYERPDFTVIRDTMRKSTK